MLTTSIYPHHPRNRNFQIATLEIFSNPCPEIQSNTGTSHKDLLKIWVDIVDRLSPWLAKKPPFDSDTRTWSSSSLASWSLIGCFNGEASEHQRGYLNNGKWSNMARSISIILSTVSGKIMHFGAKTSRFKFTNFLSLTPIPAKLPNTWAAPTLSSSSGWILKPQSSHRFREVSWKRFGSSIMQFHVWSLHTFTVLTYTTLDQCYRPWYNLAMLFAMHATAWPFETHKSTPVLCLRHQSCLGVANIYLQNRELPPWIRKDEGLVQRSGTKMPLWVEKS